MARRHRPRLPARRRSPLSPFPCRSGGEAARSRNAKQRYHYVIAAATHVALSRAEATRWRWPLAGVHEFTLTCVGESAQLRRGGSRAHVHVALGGPSVPQLQQRKPPAGA